MVFGDVFADDAATLGNRVYLPVAGDGFVNIAELDFVASRGPGLFGNKDELLDEWRGKLALVPAQSPDE